MSDEYSSAPEALAEMTGRPKEEFEADFGEYPIPELDELESTPIDEFECPCGCTEGNDD